MSQSPPTLRAPESGHVRRREWLATAVGVALSLLLVLAVFAWSRGGVLAHTECARGPAIVNEGVWTPFSLANAPYLGSTTYGAQFMNWDLFGWTNVTLTTIEPLGRGNLSTGYFEIQNWTVFSQSNRSVAGPGVNLLCQSAYVAAMSHTTFDVAFNGVVLQGPGNTSNTHEPSTFNDSGPQPAATFSDGFVRANEPAVSTCGSSARELNFTSESFDVSIPFTSPSGPATVDLAIISAENYTYAFPANAGTWSVDDLQENSALVGPGLAFSWQPC